MSKEEKKVNRRDFLFTATYTVGAVGVGAVIWPMIDQMNPDKAQQALATTEVDISNIEPGKSSMSRPSDGSVPQQGAAGWPARPCACPTRCRSCSWPECIEKREFPYEFC